MSAKLLRVATNVNVDAHLTSLADDEILLVLTNLDARALAAIACVSRKMLILSSHEKDRLRKERAKEEALERQRKRIAKARFAALEGDARVLGTVIRHMLMNAPSGYSLAMKAGRKKVLTPAGGVCRLHVGVTNGGVSITTDERHTVDYTVDVLAMQEAALRAVTFEGEPLGAAGAAVALRQAKLLRLDVPENTTLYGRVFRLFVRADVLRDYIANSPTLAALLLPGGGAIDEPLVAHDGVAADVAQANVPMEVA